MKLEHIRELRAMSTEDVEFLTLEMLRGHLSSRVGPLVAFYRDRWREAGVQIGRLESFEELRALPVTTHDDVARGVGAGGQENAFVMGAEAAGDAPGLSQRLRTLLGAVGVLSSPRRFQADMQPSSVAYEAFAGGALPVYYTRYDALSLIAPALRFSLELSESAGAAGGGLRVLDLCPGTSRPESQQLAFAALGEGFLHARGALSSLDHAWIEAVRPSVLVIRPDQLDEALKDLPFNALAAAPRLAVVLEPGQAFDAAAATERLRGLAGDAASVVRLLSIAGLKILLPEVGDGSEAYLTFPHLHHVEALGRAGGDAPVDPGAPCVPAFTHVDGRGTTFARLAAPFTALGGVTPPPSDKGAVPFPRLVGPFEPV
jgi:hypothetical protein